MRLTNVELIILAEEECKIFLALHPGDFVELITTITESLNYLTRDR